MAVSDDNTTLSPSLSLPTYLPMYLSHSPAHRSPSTYLPGDPTQWSWQHGMDSGRGKESGGGGCTSCIHPLVFLDACSETCPWALLYPPSPFLPPSIHPFLPHLFPLRHIHISPPFYLPTMIRRVKLDLTHHFSLQRAADGMGSSAY